MPKPKKAGDSPATPEQLTALEDSPPGNPEDLIPWFDEDPHRVLEDIEEYILTAEVAEDILLGNDKPRRGFGNCCLRLITWGDHNGFQSETSKLYKFASWLAAFPPIIGQPRRLPSPEEFEALEEEIRLLTNRMIDHVRLLIKQAKAQAASGTGDTGWFKRKIPAGIVKNFEKVWQKICENLVDWQAKVIIKVVIVFVIVIIIGLISWRKPEWVIKIFQWLKGLKELLDFGTGTFLS